MKTGFIDWTEKEINLYFFEKSGHSFELIDSTSVPVEDELNPEQLIPFLKRGMDNTYVSVPIDLLTLREMEFPFSDRDKIRDTISFELEGLLLGDTSDYSINHIILESLDTGSKVLAVCLEKERIRGIIDMFSAAGIDPRVITSIDLWLYGGRGENLLGKPISDKNVRAETARQELANPSINLRSGELAYTGDIEKFKKRLRLTAALVLILLVIIGINSTFRLNKAKDTHAFMQRKLHSIYRAVYPEDKKIIDVRRQFEGNLNSLKKKKEILAGVPILEMLLDIAKQGNQNVTLHEFNSDANNIIIKGTASSFEDVETMRNSLSAKFKTVKVMDSSATADKKINFTIVMQERSV